MRNHSSIVLLSIMLTGAVITCPGQTPTPMKTTRVQSENVTKDRLAQLTNIDETLRTTAKEISERNPDLTPQLVNDAKVILALRKDVSSTWNNVGYDSDSQKKAESYIWRELRLKILKPNEPLKPDTWSFETNRRGRLAVLSDPDQAAIYMDNGSDPVNRSNDFIFPSVGQHTICLKLTGYADYCEPREIKNGTNNKDLDVKLNKAP
jgi:hypothetical protein